MDSEMFILPVPATHPCFAGHFPGNPVVPGALLLTWLKQQIFERLGLRVTGIKQIKFLAPVLPGQHLTVDLGVATYQVQLSVSCQGQEVLKGSFLLPNN